MTSSRPLSTDTATFERLAREALDRLPEPFQDHLADVVIRIEEFADDETLDAMDLDDRWELTGRPANDRAVGLGDRRYAADDHTLPRAAAARDA
jgi:predicted Zn-dependent protease with MMP-like domain